MKFYFHPMAVRSFLKLYQRHMTNHKIVTTATPTGYENVFNDSLRTFNYFHFATNFCWKIKIIIFRLFPKLI